MRLLVLEVLEHIALVSEGVRCLHTDLKACHQVSATGQPAIYTFTASKMPQHLSQIRHCWVQTLFLAFPAG